ncbi:hypothetical protein [Methylomonas rosea]|nr:hypothetical protein [Methylomonas sp. WSC-7]MCQ8116030.1 hypothetical protein [Methylomonas sp. WSC-7]
MARFVRMPHGKVPSDFPYSQQSGHIMLSTWENLILGALALLLLFWMQPGIKAALARSKQTPSDWPSVIVPLLMVVMFVLFLIAMV